MSTRRIAIAAIERNSARPLDVEMRRRRESQIRFVDQRGGVERVANPLVPELPPRDAPQLLVHEGQHALDVGALGLGRTTTAGVPSSSFPMLMSSLLDTRAQ